MHLRSGPIAYNPRRQLADRRPITGEAQPSCSGARPERDAAPAARVWLAIVRWSCVVLLVALLAPWHRPTPTGTTYYVSPAGNDRAPVPSPSDRGARSTGQRPAVPARRPGPLRRRPDVSGAVSLRRRQPGHRRAPDLHRLVRRRPRHHRRRRGTAHLRRERRRLRDLQPDHRRSRARVEQRRRHQLLQQPHRATASSTSSASTTSTSAASATTASRSAAGTARAASATSGSPTSSPTTTARPASSPTARRCSPTRMSTSGDSMAYGNAGLRELGPTPATASCSAAWTAARSSGRWRTITAGSATAERRAGRHLGVQRPNDITIQYNESHAQPDRQPDRRRRIRPRPQRDQFGDAVQLLARQRRRRLPAGPVRRQTDRHTTTSFATTSARTTRRKSPTPFRHPHLGRRAERRDLQQHDLHQRLGNRDAARHLDRQRRHPRSVRQRHPRPQQHRSTTGGVPLVEIEPSQLAGAKDLLFQGNVYFPGDGPFRVIWGRETFATLDSWRGR